MSINIEHLIPLLRPGYVAMDKDKKWHWFRFKPAHWNYKMWKTFNPKDTKLLSGPFDIEPFNGPWYESLIKIDRPTK